MLDINELILSYPISLVFFKNAKLNNLLVYNYFEFDNPFYFDATALLFNLRIIPGFEESSSIDNDFEIVRPIHNEYAWVLKCFLIVFNLKYIWVNQFLVSSILKFFNTFIIAIFEIVFWKIWMNNYLIMIVGN